MRTQEWRSTAKTLIDLNPPPVPLSPDLLCCRANRGVTLAIQRHREVRHHPHHQGQVDLAELDGPFV
ncbi:unnamed protein product [Urochloa humidicola]